MLYIAIDGSSRRNGKPDCLGVGAAYAKRIELETGKTISSALYGKAEKRSTNQRAELLALVLAMRTALKLYKNGEREDLYLVTDSEYIYNAITKEWFKNWEAKGWITASGGDVKNRDIWGEIAALYNKMEGNIGFTIYHIKGHLLSMGKVTARKAIEADTTGEYLYNSLVNKYSDAKLKNPDKFEHATELFERNHGYAAPDDVFREMVINNSVVDLYANYLADIEDADWVR